MDGPSEQLLAGGESKDTYLQVRGIASEKNLKRASTFNEDMDGPSEQLLAGGESKDTYLQRDGPNEKVRGIASEKNLKRASTFNEDMDGPSEQLFAGGESKDTYLQLGFRKDASYWKQISSASKYGESENAWQLVERSRERERKRNCERGRRRQAQRSREYSFSSQRSVFDRLDTALAENSKIFWQFGERSCERDRDRNCERFGRWQPQRSREYSFSPRRSVLDRLATALAENSKIFWQFGERSCGRDRDRNCERFGRWQPQRSREYSFSSQRSVFDCLDTAPAENSKIFWQFGERSCGRDRDRNCEGGRRRQPPQSRSAFDCRGGYIAEYNSRSNLHHSYSPSRSERNVRPYLLVKCLAEYPNFRATLLNLMEVKQLPPNNVRKVAMAYPRVFSLEGEELVLQPQVDICITFEEHQTCKNLHICPKFALSTCNDKDCTLGHRWLTDHNTHILQQFYIDRLSYNDFHRLMQTLAKTKVQDFQENIRGESNEGCIKRDGTAPACQSISTDVAECPVAKDTSSENEQQIVWTHNLYGDTEINELCYYSVENVCRYESSGCRRLHSAYHYHWQVSEEGSKWLNLRNSQVKKLEVSFCNPDEISVDLPRLDPAELDTSTKYLLLVMGRDTWKANFQAMTVTNSTQSKVLYLRRLCTERIAGQVIDGNVYNWYFLDKNKKWVMYGKVDTAGEKNLVSSVTSDDIEKHYLQSQGSPLTFKNASFTYTLNFSSMTQTNEQTKVSREVCRRPQPHIKVDSTPTTAKSNPGSDTSDLPSSWEPMQPQERVRLVEISPTSSEYQTVLSLVKGQIQQTGIQKIQRIQNPYLWRAFQNKIREMTSIHGDLSKVNVKQIFHGTGYNVVANICAENFDWRLHGTSTGQMHGRGTYFSPNVSTSVGYCKPDTSGVKYLFVAQVAVGSITRGNSSTVRPPLNPATKTLFDSTGDGTDVIVKYDKQEYYPEYVLSFR
ncbi:protein mono-ADP-ribosyltransferase PARP12-like isoform X2 [Penaeus japonicus]|uniref:protein mono-ADP-ribosyltransferase PARP12-like isoform X2 n=1 Tax=Penaeus japonicus TaxID=27405 RepID=UPI001C712742|nr:protein mono-ADP-ribosyltransferase PARP12-like isoform X2 [Penaeus japonicus]